MIWGNIFRSQFSINEITDRHISTLVKARQLSFVGRVTLTKFVLKALLSYVMKTTLLPKSICYSIDKKCREFEEGSLASLSSLCMTKSQGGPGLHEM
ncbi:putative ribonuclease H protein, partial [Mucuna pruriens]